MTAEEMKEIADEVNQDNIDKADSDLNHVQIEINESAKKGNYGLDYSFVPDTDFSIVNEIKNRLIADGFDVEISTGENMGKECLELNIDWSKD
jgi:hypothetical protein